MNKIKKRLFAWSIILFMLSNTVFTNTSLMVYAEEETNGVWSEDFSDIASWGEAFPADSPIQTVDEITTTNSFSNNGGIQFRLDKEAICLMGSDKNMTPSVTTTTDVKVGQPVSFSFDWSESDGLSESTNKLGVYYSFDGQTFQTFTLAEDAALPKASNGADNTDESGKFTATIPVEQVTGTKLEIKIAAEDDNIVADRTGFILDNLYIAQIDTTTNANGAIESTDNATTSEVTGDGVQNGASTDVEKTTNGSDVTANAATGYDETVVKTIASIDGTGPITGATVYGDLNIPNDFLNTAVVLTHSTGKTLKMSNNSLGYTGFNAGEYYQLQLNSKLIGNLSVSFRMKGSSTGPKNFTLSYSTDGTSFTNVSGGVSIAAASTWQTFNLTLPEGAADAENLMLRFTAEATAINGSTLKTNGTGSNYLSGLVVSGNPVVSDQVCGVVKPSPEAGEVAMNQEITLTSATEGATIKYSFDKGANWLTYDPDNKPKFTQLPAKLTVVAEKDTLTSSVEMSYDYTQLQVGAIKASPNGGAVLINTNVKLTCETEGATVMYSSDNGTNWTTYITPIVLTQLPATILTKAVKEGYVDSATSTLSYSLRQNSGYSIYFGQLHSHTSYSDGAGSCDDAFKYAKESAEQIDFLAVTDHSNSFDNDTKATLADGSASTEWVEGHKLANDYTDSSFVGIYGFEMTWSNGLGHINTFNTGGFQSRTQTAYTTYSTALQNYYAELKKQTASISQFNHPGTTFGDFSDFAYYDEAIDAQISLVEVGNGEGAIGSSGYFPSYEYYTRALDKGWHVAPTNNQDNHKGKWGDANTARTVVLADSLTQDNIYDAMRNMRVYATEDNDLEILYTLNDAVMGTVLTKDDVSDTVSLAVNLKDPTDSAIGKVEVIVNGGLSAASETVDVPEKLVNFTLPSSYSYYYIKVTEPDGNIAVTAPVWVGEVESVGISKFATTEKLPISGEPVGLSLDLYNNEEQTLNIQSIEYSINDQVIHIVDLTTAGLTSLAQLATKNYSFNYTYDGVGAINLDVTVKGNLNGVEKVYKDVLKLTYKDPAMVTNVIIDGSHFNDYVTGYYGANMNNITQIAAEDDVKVKIVKDQFTQDTLANCSLLIISAPARKTGTGNAGAFTPSSFEDDFIALVKAYVERGGDVIVCGLADYQDAATGQSSKEINKLLQAIGATTTIYSDEMYDMDNNGGQAYRLYLKSYNKDTTYTSNILDEQTFSSYSGCTVALDPTAVADGRAVALVKGHSTTYSINTRDDVGATITGTPVLVNKGEVVALAKETLSSGANVFVAGNVFMSDFEVKAELDNIWSVPYANRTIMENIMNDNKTSIPVSSISDVRKGTMGSVYSVEGYVTAGTSVAGNTFFDTIYLQDSTGGIDIFPISTSGIAIGTKMKIVGTLDQYQGDTELRVISSEILSDEPNVFEPTEISTKDASNYALYGGMLVKVKGTITQIQKENGIVTQIVVKDESGESAKVFIDGYIYAASIGKNTLASSIKEGDTISAVGIVYNHPEGTSDTPVSVLRVRNCDEITVTPSSEVVVETPTYTVSFSSQGGSSISSQAIKQGEKVIMPGNPTKEGYTFAGWFKEEACSNVWNFESDIVTNETTLYAKWTENKVTPTENKVTQLALANTSLSLGKGATYSMQITITPNNALNQSVSWSSSDASVVTVDSNGKIAGVKYGAAIITAKTLDGSNIEASCKVTVGYNITYKLNKGTNNSANPTSFYKEKITLKNPSRTGYTFKGWYTDKKYTTKISSISKSTKKNVTVYAKWEKVSVDKASIKSLGKAKTDRFTVKLDKVNNAKGYEIMYATDKKFTKDSNTLTITSRSKTITGLQKEVTYYVKARAYKMDSTGNKVYGKYSKVKKVVIK